MIEKEKQAERKGKIAYHNELKEMIGEKRLKKKIETREKMDGHNPIVNPIQFRIENPYILK